MVLTPAGSDSRAAGAQPRQREDARARRERRRRAEARVRLILVKDAACLAGHRGGPERGGSGVSPQRVRGAEPEIQLLRREIADLRLELKTLREEMRGNADNDNGGDAIAGATRELEVAEDEFFGITTSEMGAQTVHCAPSAVANGEDATDAEVAAVEQEVAADRRVVEALTELIVSLVRCGVPREAVHSALSEVNDEETFKLKAILDADLCSPHPCARLLATLGRTQPGQHSTSSRWDS